MSDQIASAVDELLDERPHLQEELQEILEVDRNNNRWTFDDVPLDSGEFGEVVEKGIVVKTDDGYMVPDRTAVEAVISDKQIDRSSTTDESVIRKIQAKLQYDVLHPWVIENRILCSLLLVSLGGFMFRIYAISEVPLLDGEALVGLASYGILEQGAPLFPSEIRYHRGPLVLLSTAVTTALLGENLVALRLPSVIVGTLVVPLVYLLGATVKDRMTGLVGATLLSVAQLHIAWSRTARFYIFLQFFLVLGALSYFKFIESSDKEKNYRYVGLFLLALICAYFTHRGWVFLLAFVGIAIATPRLDQRSLLTTVRIGAILTGVAVLMYIHLTQSFLFFDELLELVGLPTSGQFEIWRHPHLESPPHSFFPTYYPLLSLFAVAGGIITFKERNRNLLTLVLFLVFSVWSLTYLGGQIRHVWRPRYLLFLLPFFFLLAATTLVDTGKYIAYVASSRTKLSSTAVNGAVLLAVVAALIISPMSAGIGVAPDAASLSQLEEPQPNYRGICYEIGDQIREDDVVITNRPAQVSFWFDKVDYRGNTVLSNITGNNEDRYTGEPAIQNDSHMQQVIKNHNRVWIIYNPFMPLKGEEWIKESLPRHTVAKEAFASRTPHGLYDMDDESAQEAVFVFTKGVSAKNRGASDDGIQTRCGSH